MATLLGIRSQLLKALLPAPAELRRLADYVDVAKLRLVDDPDVIAARFVALQRELLAMAQTLETEEQLWTQEHMKDGPVTL